MSKLKAAQALAMAAILSGNTGLLKPKKPEKQWKPQFTKEELEFIRSLPKKEKKKEVERLRAKYRREK